MRFDPGRRARFSAGLPGVLLCVWLVFVKPTQNAVQAAA
jgi:hypothetical protein